jgi:hypothetical protein
MKVFLIIPALLLTLAPAALAEASDVCTKFIPCGTFAGTGGNFDANFKRVKGYYAHVVEKVVITAESATVARVQETLYTKGHEDNAYVLNVRFEFQENGQYNAIGDDGHIGAAGICRHSVCTFSFFPNQNADKTLTGGNVNIMRFENGKLERTMMVTTKLGERHFQETELTKQ